MSHLKYLSMRWNLWGEGGEGEKRRRGSRAGEGVCCWWWDGGVGGYGGLMIEAWVQQDLGKKRREN